MHLPTRRDFLRSASFATPAWLTAGPAPAAQTRADAARLVGAIEKNRPTRLSRLPSDFNARVGATHVGGKYHLGQKPFLVEGAEKLIELGTRLGKFWFNPAGIQTSYPFNSRWDEHATLLDLARSDYFAKVFAMPFSTILLESQSRTESAWKTEQPQEFYDRVTQEYHDLAAHFYKAYPDRAFTIILQHWEGDWMLRGLGKPWSPPPPDWPLLCERMARWLAARQAGVAKARAAHGAAAKCRVAHAAEVNKVTDIAKGIPTMTDKVLPLVELDLVSYSAYDGMKDPPTLHRCIETIRKHARTGPLFGKGAIYVGEIGIPENEHPAQDLADRWDALVGAALAAGALYIVHWELYCNEFNKKLNPPPQTPVRNPADMRGFWLAKPDGTLGESGRYLRGLWQRAAQGA